jgi:hypothetical protein
MDRYVLHRVRAMLDEFGIVEFNAILERQCLNLGAIINGVMIGAKAGGAAEDTDDHRSHKA